MHKIVMCYIVIEEGQTSSLALSCKETRCGISFENFSKVPEFTWENMG